MSIKINKKFLEKTIELASESLKNKNYPCGSLIVDSKGTVIAEYGNKVFSTPDATAHAEMLCIRKGGKCLLDKDSKEKYTIYSSMEPCSGCAFFIARTNIKRIVYACGDRYRPGIKMLKANPKFKKYFEKIELVEEPSIKLRNKSAILMRDYMLAKGRSTDAAYFDPINF
ncbi:MAG: nucleoside deaminase [bacterium]